MYQTQARIVIQDERSTAVANLNATDPVYWQDPEPYFNTQYRILQSRGLARRVVRKLPPPPVPAPSTLSRALSLPRQMVNRWRTPPPAAARRSSGGGRNRQRAGGHRRVPRRRRNHSGEGHSPRRDRLYVIRPQYAALAANTLAREYVQQNLDLKLANTTETINWLGEELGKQRDKVEAAERAMAEYQEGQNAMSLDDRQNIVIARLNSLNDAVTKAKTARLHKEAAYRQLGNLRGDSADADSYPMIAQNSTIQEIKQQLAHLNGEKAKMSLRYGPQHPEMERITNQIESSTARLRAETAKLLESIGNDYRAAMAEEQNLSGSLEEQKRHAIDLNRKNITFSILQREAESERQVYNALLQQEKELRVVSNSRANNVQLMDDAEAAGAPLHAKPQPRLAAGAGARAGSRCGGRVCGGIPRRHREAARRT